ncbi:MAG: glycerol-3-phosphate dehydrogenase/oxidase [Actinomycetota bacterium]|nr:glycerol-3-phosphate dehydrogenase/oxidase [Actinomycetota bacterium]MDD5667333.1 glycerol-3-phosphate dehydrogenase/oxidase [Actinomycetota bacterium]
MFSSQQRKEDIERAQGKVFDVLIVGGGITGACAARDAVRRGLSTAIVEKNDWAFGTSSRSSKLVHGGLRYLELFDFKLVFEACRERRRLLLNAPHVVWPQSFMFPVYKGDKNPLFIIAMGLWLYDFLALFRNVQNHQLHGPKRILEVEPELDSERLTGGGQFYDCSTDDARLTLSHVQSANLEGACCLSYTRVLDILSEEGKARGARVRDEVGGKEFDIEAKVVLNCTGPWTDAICHMDDPEASPKLRPTKGAHVIVPWERARATNALPIISPADERLMFLIPWGDYALIGTTDTDYDGDYDTISASREDVQYILDAANRTLPGAHLAPDDVISTYAGLRPLVVEGGGKDVKESQVSREHSIYESHSGLISIAGGKLTTARSMAQELVDLAARRLEERFGVRAARCTTRKAPVFGVDGGDFRKRLERMAGELRLDDDIVSKLQHLGTGAVRVLALLAEGGSLAERLGDAIPYIEAEVVYSAREEMVVSLSDYMVRRSLIYYEDREQGLGCAERVADLLGAELGWDAEEKGRQVEEYRRVVELSRSYKNA